MIQRQTMSRPPAQQLTALAANVFNPPRGDQGCAEEEALGPGWLRERRALGPGGASAGKGARALCPGRSGQPGCGPGRRKQKCSRGAGVRARPGREAPPGSEAGKGLLLGAGARRHMPAQPGPACQKPPPPPPPQRRPGGEGKGQGLRGAPAPGINHAGQTAGRCAFGKHQIKRTPGKGRAGTRAGGPLLVARGGRLEAGAGGTQRARPFTLGAAAGGVRAAEGSWVQGWP